MKEELLRQAKYKELLKLIGSSEKLDDLEYKAYALQKSGQFEGAMQVWTQLIASDERASFYNERGVCKFNMRFKHALDDFNQAISLEIENPYFWSCRAYVKDKLGDTEGAIQDYEQAHKLDPEDATILNNLGLAEQKLGYTQRSREFFKKSNELIGYKEEGLEEAAKQPDLSLKSRWREMKKMMSSWTEFKQFLKELVGRN